MLMNLLIGASKPALVADPSAPAKKSLIQLSCENLRRDAVSDSTVVGKGLVEVSWFAVNYPEIGLPLMAHEIGHVISSTLRNVSNYGSLPFANALTCVAKRDPFNMNPTSMMEPNDNSATSEEDFADHFSSLVMNKLTSRGILGCNTRRTLAAL